MGSLGTSKRIPAVAVKVRSRTQRILIYLIA